MTDLSALIARVEEGTGPDRELDLAVCLEIGRLQRDDKGEVFYIDEDGARVFGGHGWEIITPKLTDSLDRVLSLIEQKLPGWVVSTIGQSDDRSWWAELRRGHQTSYDNVALSNLKCASAPRAALAATLRAIQSKEAHTHGA